MIAAKDDTKELYIDNPANEQPLDEAESSEISYSNDYPDLENYSRQDRLNCTLDDLSREDLKEECKKLCDRTDTWRVVLYSVVGTVITASLFCGLCSCLFFARQDRPGGEASITIKTADRNRDHHRYTEKAKLRRKRSSKSRIASPAEIKAQEPNRSEYIETIKPPANEYPQRLEDLNTKSIATAEVAFWSPRDSGPIHRSLSKEFFQSSKTKTVINPATKSPVIIHRPAPPPPTRVSPDRTRRLNIVRPAPPPPTTTRKVESPLTPVRPAPPPPRAKGRDESEPPTTPRSPLPTIGISFLDSEGVPLRPKRRRKKDYSPQMPI